MSTLSCGPSTQADRYCSLRATPVLPLRFAIRYTTSTSRGGIPPASRPECPRIRCDRRAAPAGPKWLDLIDTERRRIRTTHERQLPVRPAQPGRAYIL